MRRVVDAAEAGVRERMERKVLKAASLGYTKGVAAGRQAEAREARASRDAAREKAPSVEDAVPLSAKRAGSDAGVDDAASIFSEDSAAVAAEGALSRDDENKAVAAPAGRFFSPARVKGGDSAKEPSVGSLAPSTPSSHTSPAGDEARKRAPCTLPPDAGRMPDEVVVTRALGTRGKTYAPRAKLDARGGDGSRGAPTAALWALSVSARDGKIPGVREDALDLIASRCQLFFAHDKLSRATLGWAAARWRLACAEPRRKRAAAEHIRRRGVARAFARSFAAWAGRVTERDAPSSSPPDETRERTSRDGVEGAFAREGPSLLAGDRDRDEDRDEDSFFSPVSAPPPRLDRDVAAGLVDQITVLKEQNAALTVSLREARDALEASGPTPREAAQSEKFRAHLQRLQRELEATRQARDAARDESRRASREAAREATARRSSLKGVSTQTGGFGDLSRLAQADRDVAAEATALELKTQAAKFHVEFERQAKIAEEATAKLRDERGVRARAEEAHRRELARVRENHAAELAAARAEWEHRARVARANATGDEADAARDAARAKEKNAAAGGGVHPGPGPGPGPAALSPESRRLTADRLAALEREAGQMRHSEKVEEKVKGWEVTGILAEGRADSPPASPATRSRERERGGESGGGGASGAGMPPPAPRRLDPEDPWGDAAAPRRRRDGPRPSSDFPRAPASAAGSERSTRSRAGTAAAVVAAVRAGGASAVDALLASGALDADDDESPAFGSHSRAGSGVGSGSVSGSVSGLRHVARPPASATLAVAQLVMRGHAKADAEAAVAAAGVDVDAAHAWIARRYDGA